MKYRDFKINGGVHRFTDPGLIVLMDEAGDLWDIIDGSEGLSTEDDGIIDQLKADLSRLERRIFKIARKLLREGRGYLDLPSDEEEW